MAHASAHAVQISGSAPDSEGAACAVVILGSWLIPPCGVAPLLLLPDKINLSMGYCGDNSHVSLQFSCRGKPLPARRIKQMLQCLACLALKYVSSSSVSSNVDDCFPLSRVGGVYKVQMQLVYKQETMISTSPKENSTV